MLKVLNPLIWLWNTFKYLAYLDSYRGKEYDNYDFSKLDTKYF